MEKVIPFLPGVGDKPKRLGDTSHGIQVYEKISIDEQTFKEGPIVEGSGTKPSVSIGWGTRGS